MKITEVSPNCLEALQHNQSPFIVGVSINNSYFNEHNLEQLLVWSSHQGVRVKVMIPDEPMIDTFMALGYSRSVASKKARLKGNALENKCHMVIGRHGLRNVVVVRWSQIIEKQVYQQALKKMEDLYKTNADFKNAVQSTTVAVMHANGITEPKSENVEMGKGFLLKELAFLTHACYMFREQKYCYVYHKLMPVLKELIEGKYPIDVSEDIGYAVVK